MAVTVDKTAWVEMFTQARMPSGFLSRMFTIKNGGIFNGKKVAIDIQRTGEQVAVVVKHGTGVRLNDADVFETKEFTPPAYGEGVPFDVLDLLERQAGTNPYDAAYTQYAGDLLQYMIKGFALIDDKIKRAIEMQASQILQTGKLSLIDDAGNVLYDLDFSPKATHFPTAGTAWGVGGSDPLADLLALAKVIRSDGKVNPDRLLFGDSESLQEFLNDTKVQAALDSRRMDVIEIAPEMADSGATFYGHVWIGTYRFEIWAYPDTYEHIQTGAMTSYIDNNKVVMLSSRTRLDMACAKVPAPIAPDPRVSHLLPSRATSRSAGFDVTPNVYATPNGKQIVGELESRTLLIPVQIDGFGCLNTGV